MQCVRISRRSTRRERLSRRRKLWRVHGRDHESKHDLAVGYLVTSDESLVAYIPRLGLASLRLAVRIRRGGEPVNPAHDLRFGFPRTLAGYLLRPVSDNGHAIANDGFPAAMYTLFRFDEGEKLELKTFTVAGFALLKARSEAWAERQRKSGAPHVPNAATPGSRRSEERGTTAA